jgi:hypothetical protein
MCMIISAVITSKIDSITPRMTVEPAATDCSAPPPAFYEGIIIVVFSFLLSAGNKPAVALAWRGRLQPPRAMVIAMAMRVIGVAIPGTRWACRERG